jgi:hypothetical protein
MSYQDRMLNCRIFLISIRCIILDCNITNVASEKRLRENDSFLTHFINILILKNYNYFDKDLKIKN